MTQELLWSPFICRDCLFFDRVYGTDEGWCKNPDSDHWHHIVRGSHPSSFAEIEDENGVVIEGEYEFCFSDDDLVSAEEEDGGHA